MNGIWYEVIDMLGSEGLCVVSRCLGGGVVGLELIGFDREARVVVTRRVERASL